MLRLHIQAMRAKPTVKYRRFLIVPLKLENMCTPQWRISKAVDLCFLRKKFLICAQKNGLKSIFTPASPSWNGTYSVKQITKVQTVSLDSNLDITLMEKKMFSYRRNGLNGNASISLPGMSPLEDNFNETPYFQRYPSNLALSPRRSPGRSPKTEKSRPGKCSEAACFVGRMDESPWKSRVSGVKGKSTVSIKEWTAPICADGIKKPLSRKRKIKERTGTATPAVSVLFWSEYAGGYRKRW